MKKIATMLVLLSVSFLSLAVAKEEKLFKATVDTDGVQRVEVLGGSYFFNPNLQQKAALPGKPQGKGDGRGA
jgi:hypothetical protein